MGQTGKRLLDAEGFTKQGNRGDDQAVYIEGSAAVVDVRKATGTDTSDALTVRALAPDNTPTTLFQVLKNGTAKIAGTIISTFSGAFADLTGTLSDAQHGVRTLANAHDHGQMSGLADDDHPQYLTSAEGDAAYPAVAAFNDHSARHDSGGADALVADAAAGTPSLRSLGTTATTAAAGNDARLSDARTPTAHATSHNSGGADVLASDAAQATPSLRTVGGAAPVTQAFGDVAAIGSAVVPAARDHRHGMPAAPSGGTTVSITKAEATAQFSTSSTSFVDITGLSVSVSTASGTNNVEYLLTGTAQASGSIIGTYAIVDTTTPATIGQQPINPGAGGVQVAVAVYRMTTQATGAKTIKGQLKASSGTSYIGTASPDYMSLAVKEYR